VSADSLVSDNTPPPLRTEPRKTCLIYSSGGHYAEIKRAIAGICFTQCYHVTFAIDKKNPQIDEVDRRFFITHPRRKIVRTLKNAWESFWLLLRERPHYIISTGADVTVPTIVLGKLVFGCKIIFIESAGDVAPTMTGKIVYPFADLFIVQWPEKLQYFPKAVLSKGILL